jgi:hypothetical protein
MMPTSAEANAAIEIKVRRFGGDACCGGTSVAMSEGVGIGASILT